MDTVLVDGKRIRVHRQGAGQAILYLHSGTGEVGRTEFFDRLAAAGWEVVVPELPGFGKSDPAPEWRCIEDVVFHLRRTMDVLGLRSAVVIGMSLGGWLAAELAVWFPERIRALVLIDAVGLRVEGAPVYSVFPGPGWDVGEMMRRSNPHGVDFQKLLAGMDEGGGDADPEAQLLQGLGNMETIARIGWNPYLEDPKLPARLASITAPTLVLWGAEDELVPRAHGERYAQLIPDATLRVVPDSGHTPALEQPAQVAAEIAAFLGSGQTLGDDA